MSVIKPKYPFLANELERLKKLHSYDILGMKAEAQFDDLTNLTALILNLPICQITLMDKDWQHFISNVGTDMAGNNRELSFCQYTVVQDQILEVKDTLEDSRFKDHGLVANPPHIRYYVGAPLVDDDGIILGTLCGYGLAPGAISESQKIILTNLAKTVVRLIKYRKINLDQEKFVSIFGLTKDLLCVISKDGFFKVVNPAFTKLLGWTQSELLEKPVKQFIYHDDRIKVKTQLDSILKGQKESDFSCRLLTKENEYLWFSWSYVTNQNSSVIVASGHDITELLEVQESLNIAVLKANKASKIKDEFLSNMSHEIRTPLASILGYIDLISLNELGEKQKDYLDNAQVASKHLMNLVNDALDTYKLDDGELKLDLKSINFREVLNQIKQLFQHKAEVKGLDFRIEIEDGIPEFVFTDETRLIQILTNLVVNAIKFTEKGEVKLQVSLTSIEDKTAKINFNVKDTGIGIEEKLLETIFNRFTQEETSTFRNYGGTGLGLNISKKLVQLFKGNLSVTSKKNEGTCFYFEIPFEISKAIDKATNVNSNMSLSGLKILLAEDNENIQLLCKIHVERLGGIITIVSNGKDALELIRSNSKFDILLMDIQMPILDGLQTTKAIRTTLNLDIPIIGFSASSDADEKKRVTNAGMNDFISKPFEIETLVNTILNYSKIENKEDIISSLEELTLREGTELVSQFIEIFNARIPADILELKAALDQKNYQALYKKAHFLNTTFTTMNLTKGAKLSSEIQECYKNQKEDLVLEKSKTLMNYLNYSLEQIGQWK